MAFSSDPALQSNQVSISLEIPRPEDPNFETIMSLFMKRTTDAVNTKEGALYSLREVATFQQYFTAGDPQTTRNVYRMTVNFGALPNAGTKSVPHGIAFTSAFSLTRMYGAATDPVNLIYIPLPYASPTLNQNIKLNADGTNVNIETAINYTAFTRCTVVLEYTKNT